MSSHQLTDEEHQIIDRAIQLLRRFAKEKERRFFLQVDDTNGKWRFDYFSFDARLEMDEAATCELSDYTSPGAALEALLAKVEPWRST